MSLKSKLAKVVGGSSATEDPVTAQEAGKYKLFITAGPSYDKSTHKPILVNTSQATYIENELLRAKICVRIRSYRGLPLSSPSHSPYFDDPIHEKDQYSIAFSFVPKVDLPGEGSVWGNDFDHPIRDRLPPGVNTAFKIVKEFIDQGLAIDAYADEPWLYGPALSSWFALRIGEVVGQDADFEGPGGEEEVLKEGADGSGAAVRQNLRLPATYATRHKHFLSQSNRQAFRFEKGRVYQGDFYNPYVDFGNFALKLPGFSLKVIKYVDQKSHCLRYVFKNRETKEVYFNVNFNLLWGKDLEQALRKDEAQKNGKANGHVDAVNGHATQSEEDGQEASIGSTHDGQDARDSSRPQKMQLHPGSRAATAEGPNQNALVNNITNMLRNTATSDKRGQHPSVVDDDELD